MVHLDEDQLNFVKKLVKVFEPYSVGAVASVLLSGGVEAAILFLASPIQQFFMRAI